MESETLYTPQVVEIILRHKALLPPDWKLRTTEVAADDAYRFIRIDITLKELYAYDHDDRIRIARIINSLKDEISKTGIECYVEKTQ